jgi:hypothetical protein
MKNFFCFLLFFLPFLSAAYVQDSIVFSNNVSGVVLTLKKGDKLEVISLDNKGKKVKTRGYFLGLTDNERLAINYKKNLNKVHGTSILLEKIIQYKVYTKKEKQDKKMELIMNTSLVVLIILLTLLSFLVLGFIYLFILLITWGAISISLDLLLAIGLLPASFIIGTIIFSGKYQKTKIDVQNSEWNTKYYRTDPEKIVFKP